MARALDRMLEGSTYYPITFCRSVEGALNSANPRVSGLPIPAFLSRLVAKRIRENAEARLNAEGTGRHKRDVILEILRRDVQALDQVLGDKKFLLGARPTVVSRNLTNLRCVNAFAARLHGLWPPGRVLLPALPPAGAGPAGRAVPQGAAASGAAPPPLLARLAAQARVDSRLEELVHRQCRRFWPGLEKNVIVIVFGCCQRVLVDFCLV